MENINPVDVERCPIRNYDNYNNLFYKKARNMIQLVNAKLPFENSLSNLNKISLLLILHALMLPYIYRWSFCFIRIDSLYL